MGKINIKIVKFNSISFKTDTYITYKHLFKVSLISKFFTYRLLDLFQLIVTHRTIIDRKHIISYI